MKKMYYDTEADWFWSEEELREKYAKQIESGELDREYFYNFEVFLNNCLTENNGSLREVKDFHERAELVRAMETIVRHVNYEPYIDSWFMCGVADVDIRPGTTDEELECYLDDYALADLMGLFLRIMSKAKRNGGLCVGTLASKEEEE